MVSYPDQRFNRKGGSGYETKSRIDQNTRSLVVKVFLICGENCVLKSAIETNLILSLVKDQAYAGSNPILELAKANHA